MDTQELIEDAANQAAMENIDYLVAIEIFRAEFLETRREQERPELRLVK